MSINYSLFNPTGNVTALVETETPVEKQPEVAEQILAKESLCEQVGFILPGDEEADIILRMAGGEFCGNATMSTAAAYCIREKLPTGTKQTVRVKVLGTGIVPVDMEVTEKLYKGRVKMPRPVEIRQQSFSYAGSTYEYPMVIFEGISHIVADCNISDDIAVKALPAWCDELKVKGLGIMLYDKETGRLRPLVYVKEPETLYWESSCASGTTATGAYLFSKNPDKNVYSFEEPGGVLTVERTDSGDYLLSGVVKPLT